MSDEHDEAQMDKDYERGYAAGRLKGRSETALYLRTLDERLNYLKKGGRWGLPNFDNVEPERAYVEGFEDAMKTLGVK
jgi:hypothetical protein